MSVSLVMVYIIIVSEPKILCLVFISVILCSGALMQEVVGAWPLSPVLCVAWVFADVFLCTSSILSLTAICIGK